MLRLRCLSVGRVTLVALALSTGCIAEPPPTTLAVESVQPREVDVGDRLEIRGAGFPLRRTAKIVFHGHVHRPGVPAESVTTAIDVESRSEGRLEVPVDDALAARFSANGDSGHATFRGDIAVSFPPSETGAAPLAGKASSIVLDVRATRHRKAGGDDVARASAELLGLEIGGEAAASGGLVVAAVRPASPAAGAGVLAGDVIVDFDGVHVASLADLVPSGDSVVRIAVRREGSSSLRTISIPLDGIARRVSRGMMAAAASVAAAALLLLLSMRRPSGSSALVERRLAARLRALRVSSPATMREAARAVLSILAGESSFRPSVSAVTFTFAAAAIALAIPLFAPGLDVLALSAAAFAAPLAIAILDGGSAVRIAKPHLAGVLAVVTAVVTTGSFRLADLLRAQGALPWEWLAFRTPAALGSVVVWIAAAAAIDPRARTSERAATHVTAGLLAALFLGGFRVPGVRAIEHEPWSLAAIGALVFVLKAWLAFVAIATVRALLPIVRASLTTRRLLTAVAVVSPVIALLLGASPAGAPIARAVAAVTFGACAVVVVFAAMRLHAAIERIGAGHLDPNI